MDTKKIKINVWLIPKSPILYNQYENCAANMYLIYYEYEWILSRRLEYSLCFLFT